MQRSSIQMSLLGGISIQVESCYPQLPSYVTLSGNYIAGQSSMLAPLHHREGLAY